MIIRETRHMNKYRLRNLCIKYDWFTCGDNAEYEKLFDMAGDFSTNIGAYTLYDMAEWITIHSSEESMEDIDLADVMGALAGVCYSTFEIIDD